MHSIWAQKMQILFAKFTTDTNDYVAVTIALNLILVALGICMNAVDSAANLHQYWLDTSRVVSLCVPQNFVPVHYCNGCGRGSISGFLATRIILTPSRLSTAMPVKGTT